MKKIITLILVLIVTISVNASHLMGGQITAHQISGLTYEGKLTLYRDMFGITMPPQATINITNVSSGTGFTSIASHLAPISLLNGVEEYVYTYTVTFPSPGNYIISWNSCCRNDAIINIQNASSQSFFIFNSLTVDTISGNSSPVFLNSPVVLAQVNDTFYYNPLPFDVDGDSLTWSVDTPAGTSPTNLLPYTTPSSLPGGAFSMNPITGEVTWIPNTLGHFVASFIIEEFRNGVKIGEIRRDMQYIVVDFPGNVNRAAINTSGWPVDANGNFMFDVDINTPFSLSVIVSDGDGDTINVTANGEPFILTNNAAVWNNISNLPGYSENVFSWSPTASETRMQPYLAVIRVLEIHNGFALVRDKTIQLKVGDFTSIEEENSLYTIGNIYPLPSSGSLYFPVTVKKDSDLKINFVNQLGQEVKKLDININARQNLLYFEDLNLPSGIYFINTIVEGEKQVRKIIIK